MILHSSGNEILKNQTPEEYNIIINVLEHAILSTDLALYFKKRQDYFNAVSNKWVKIQLVFVLLTVEPLACSSLPFA